MLDFKLAREFNPFGIQIFTFFLIQLFLRGFFYFFSATNYYALKQIVTIDLMISLGLFSISFKPFIIDCFRF
jgi:hypothetical protein